MIDQGIETIALKPPVASQLGTTAGLLVVYVDPETAAFEAGLQAGDVIQSINGKAVSDFQPAGAGDDATSVLHLRDRSQERETHGHDPQRREEQNRSLLSASL